MHALTEVATLGPFFAVETEPTGDGWRPLAALAAPAALGERVAAAQAMLELRAGCAVEARVAASIQFLGTAARLLSPALATTVRHGITPRLSDETVSWRAANNGAVAFAIMTRETATMAQAVAALDGVAAAVSAQFRLSPRIVRGNVASALAGAASMLGPAARTVVEPLVAGAGSYGTERFKRNSCCLFYRVPNAGKCGDCVLLNL
jgi:hypothetical protein